LLQHGTVTVRQTASPEAFAPLRCHSVRCGHEHAPRLPHLGYVAACRDSHPHGGFTPRFTPRARPAHPRLAPRAPGHTNRVPTCRPCFIPAAPMGLAQDPAEASPPQQGPCLSARRTCSGVRCTSPGVSSVMARSSPGPWAPPRHSPAGRRPDLGFRRSRRPPGAEAPHAPRLQRVPRSQRPLMGFPGARLQRLPKEAKVAGRGALQSLARPAAGRAFRRKPDRPSWGCPPRD
jgi:hypothetical protein